MRHARRNSAPPSRSRAIAALAALLLTSGLGVTAAYATPSDGAALDEVAALQDEAAKGAGESTEVPADGLTPQPEANDSSTEITDAPEAESQPNESSAVPTVADESLSVLPGDSVIPPALPEGKSQADQGAQLRSTPPIAPQCGPGFVYGVTENGQVRQIDPNGAITALGSAASGVSSFNGLGIG